MDIKTAIKERRSIRKYKDIQIEEDIRTALDELAKECNEESGLNIQIIYDDPDCFKNILLTYGRFKNVKNYIALVGDKSIEKLDEKCGYYGQKLVLKAQQLGLNTCWVGGSFSKGKCKAVKEAGEKLVCVISLGYGDEPGVKHKSKPVSKLCNVAEEDMPVWFKNGMVAAMMAPTALNQQKFYVTLNGEEVIITPQKAVFAKVDLGIVKYNFEAVTGKRCL